MTTKRILVTGGTGHLGRLIVPELAKAGHAVRVLSRNGGLNIDGIVHTRADLVRDVGIGAALRGQQIVLHLAGGQKGDDVAARNLAREAVAAGVEKIVFVSVVGADTMPVTWLRNKAAAEQAIIDSGIPWTILRAAQFHYLTYAIVGAMARLPIVPVPGGMMLQPVGTSDVAQRLVDLTLADAAGRVRDMVGPEELGIRELIGSVLRARGKRRLMMSVRLPGAAGRAYRAGDNLALSDVDRGSATWAEFLAQQR